MALHPAQSLLLDHVQPPPDARVLLLEGGDGTLASELSRLVPGGQVLNLNRDCRAYWASKSKLQSIPNTSTEPTTFPTTSGFDLALLTIPKERRFARTLLLAAWQALKPGGILLLSGPTRKGAKAVITDASRLFGGVTVLGYRRHQRVAFCTRGDTLPNPLPESFRQIGINPGTTHTFKIQRPQGSLTLETHPGIFSWDALDQGTALLLDHLSIGTGMRVWDVGCGYGAIGLSAALAGASQVWMTDINLIALDYSKQNAARNHLTPRVRVFPSDGLETPSPDEKSKTTFDLVVSNPAFHQGRTVDISMADRIIAQAPLVLSPGGSLIIVANRFLNYDRFMQNYFSRVTHLVETPKFHILQAENDPISRK